MTWQVSQTLLCNMLPHLSIKIILNWRNNEKKSISTLKRKLNLFLRAPVRNMWRAELQRQAFINRELQYMEASDRFHRTAAEAKDSRPTRSLWTHLCICSYSLRSDTDSVFPEIDTRSSISETAPSVAERPSHMR